MKKEIPILTESASIKEIKNSTHYANKRISKFLEVSEEIIADLHRAPHGRQNERHDADLCPYCFYIDAVRIGGAALTESNCQICGTVTHFNSTSTDRLCNACAKIKGLCVRCMAKIDLL